MGVAAVVVVVGRLEDQLGVDDDAESLRVVRGCCVALRNGAFSLAMATRASPQLMRVPAGAGTQPA